MGTIEKCCGDQCCTTVNAQYADISLAVTVKPTAVVGDIETTCVGDPILVVTPCHDTCCCCGCEVKITQTLCINIPISYCADADVGMPCVVCKKICK